MCMAEPAARVHQGPRASPTPHAPNPSNIRACPRLRLGAFLQPACIYQPSGRLSVSSRFAVTSSPCVSVPAQRTTSCCPILVITALDGPGNSIELRDGDHSIVYQARRALDRFCGNLRVPARPCRSYCTLGIRYACCYALCVRLWRVLISK